MSLLVPPRRPTRELLDDPDLPWVEMRRSLADIALVNRWGGGAGALRRHLLARIRQLGRRRISILDVGAGSGQVAGRLQGALRRSGCRATVTALELQWRHLAAGRTIPPRIRIDAVAADAFHLPFRPGAFDIAVSTLFFHHFSPAQNVTLLKELLRVARHGFAFLDLRRHLIPALVVAWAGRLIFQTRVSVEDGAASVRQAYTAEEAGAVAHAAIARSRVDLVFPFRLLITGEP
jgi:SAM-dependent methyltransferase